MSINPVDSRLQSIETSLNLLAQVKQAERKQFATKPTMVGVCVGFVAIIAGIFAFAKWAMDAELKPIEISIEHQQAGMVEVKNTLDKIATKVEDIDKKVAVLSSLRSVR